MRAFFRLDCLLGRIHWHLGVLITRPESARCGNCGETFAGSTREIRVWVQEHECAGWLSEQTGDREAHTLPLGDLYEHARSEDCACGPRVRLVQCDDGTDGWVYTHHSLDGRELAEPGHEKGTT